MKRMILLTIGVLGVFVLTFTACQTSYDDDSPVSFNNEPDRSQDSYWFTQYVFKNEQLYIMELNPDVADSPTITLRPYDVEDREWPKMSFEIEKQTLLVKGGNIAIGTPVNREGKNREFFQYITEILNQSKMELPTANLTRGKFILNDNGIISQVISDPHNIIYKRSVMILVNNRDYGVEIVAHLQEKTPNANGEPLFDTYTSYIPSRGYLVVPGQQAKRIIRVDMGGETFFPIQEKKSTGAQAAIDKLSAVPKPPYSLFEATNMVMKVYKAGEDGGFFTIKIGRNNETSLYLPPKATVLFNTNRKDVDIRVERIQEYMNKVLW